MHLITILPMENRRANIGYVIYIGGFLRFIIGKDSLFG